MFSKLFLSMLALVLGGAFFFRAEKSGPSEAPIVASTDPGNPVELGDVHWLRDLDTGMKQASLSGKPLLILFQEVPGCSNCTRYGSVTLRHPLIVEAIETYFVPVCIYNNKGGKDAEALKKFNETAWNNPVVRIVNAEGKDLAPRMPDFRSSAEIVSGMLLSLEKTGQEKPAYLQLLEEELMARETGVATATFTMYCFWAGEKAFGAIPGVVETAPGFQDGKEVVRVVYNPAVVSKTQLENLTKPKGITNCAKNEGFRTDQEPKYYLYQTKWRQVSMTSLQACRANLLVAEGNSPEPVLSPRQIAQGNKVKPGDKQAGCWTLGSVAKAND
ncbi:MAG: thioredoxin family protein [Lewinellaceae bacterium]|nr:thioredoxin family protein [Lewinellaceae bacterium]